MRNNKYFVMIVISQLLIVFFLGYKIFEKNKNTLGLTTSINPIKKEVIDSNPNSKLEYFYEPVPNKTYSPSISDPWNPNSKAVYTINADSLNERYNYSIEKPKNIYRIITLGDSFTYGAFVDTKDNWTEILEDILNNQLTCKNINEFEIINLGVQGYDLQYSVERYKSRGIKYNPDLVIWFIINPTRMNERRIPLVTQIEEELKKSGKFDKLSDFDKLYKSFQMANEEINNLLGNQGIYNYQKQSLSNLRGFYKDNLALVMEPWFDDIEKKEFIEFSKNNINVSFYDKITDTRKDQFHFQGDPHPNQEGHQKIAEDVFDYLTKNKLIPCN